MFFVQRKSLLIFLFVIANALELWSVDISAEKKLSITVENIISSSSLTSSFYGVYVVDEETGEVLCDINSHKLFVPASLTKLFTSVMALNELGENYVFRTSILSSQLPSEIDNGILNGNIILKGRGDPTLSVQCLEKLAHQLELMGIQKINGQVLVDESYLENKQPLLTHAEWEDLTWYYAPEISALSINDNAVMVHIEPNPLAGQPALVCCHQHIPYFQIVNESKTIENTHANEIVMHRGLENNIVSITGNIGKNHGKIKERIAVHNPAEYARRLFLSILDNCGIVVTGDHRHHEHSHLTEIAFTESRPLKAMLDKLNKESDNLTAELLFRIIGKKSHPTGESSFESGKRVMDTTLQDMSINPRECILHEGVGVSRHNMVTPHAVAQLLLHMSNSSHKDCFKKSLTIAGVDGWLKDRFLNTIGKGNILAKSGTLSNVSALAGYAKTKQGKNVVFCIMFNQIGIPKTECVHALDNVLLTILEKS